MAMATAGGVERSASPPSPASRAKRVRSADRARPDASPKRRKGHGHRHADTPAAVVAEDEVEEGEVIDATASMDLDAGSAASYGNGAGAGPNRGERQASYSKDYDSGYRHSRNSSYSSDGYGDRHHVEEARYSDDTRRYRETSSRSDRRESRHVAAERRDSESRRSSRHSDHDRTRDSGKDQHHRDSTSSKYRTSDSYREGSRYGAKFREEDSKRQESEQLKENSSKEGHQEYQEKIEQKQITMHEDPGKIMVEARRRKEAITIKLQKQQVESVPSSKNEETRAMGGDETARLKGDNNGTSMANVGAENKHDSSKAIIAKADTTVAKPPARNDFSASTGGFGGIKIERSAVIICDGLSRGTTAGIQKINKVAALRTERNVHPDNWDDADGYYAYRVGELLGGRYEITTAHGSGVFSRVVLAKDLDAGKDDPERVAIKIIRSNDTMYRSGKQEISILEKLKRADREDKRHCVRFISNFRYRNHLCLVLESLHMNLRELIKKYGHNVGLKLIVVRLYAKQLFIALKHLKNCKVLHCDIKPDNILVNQSKNVLKLCDFGNAMDAGKNEVTPYLVSRFYRAPEIILGLPYDHPLDMWSVGCCLYELCTGKVLFAGKSNNEMLRLHMEMKGPFPNRILRRGAFTMQHFNRDLHFQATGQDPITKKVVRRTILNIKPKGIGSYISSIPGEDPKTVSSFKDLLDKMFVLDPAKRMTVEEALSHPFITSK